MPSIQHQCHARIDAPNGGGGGGRSEPYERPGDLKGFPCLEALLSESLCTSLLESERKNEEDAHRATWLCDFLARAREKHRNLKELNRELRGYPRELY